MTSSLNCFHRECLLALCPWVAYQLLGGKSLPNSHMHVEHVIASINLTPQHTIPFKWDQPRFVIQFTYTSQYIVFQPPNFLLLHVAAQHPFFFHGPSLQFKIVIVASMSTIELWQLVQEFCILDKLQIHVQNLFTTNVNIANPNYMWRTSRGLQSGCCKHIWHDSSSMMPNQSLR